MIESVYSNEGRNDFCYAGTRVGMPKNVRQIGKSNGTFGIYIEDYVKTYIKQICEEKYTECNVAVLIGKYMKNEQGCNLFIQGAMHIKEACVDGKIDFSQGVWEKVYERMKAFFPGSEAVGWFLGGPGFLMQDEEQLLRIHLNNFADREKILFMYDVLEKEELIVVSDGFKLITQEGYYIYYEKNDEMQAYMLEHKVASENAEKWESIDAKTAGEVNAFKKRNRFELVAAVVFTFVLVAAMGTMLIDKVDISAVGKYIKEHFVHDEEEIPENPDKQALLLNDMNALSKDEGSVLVVETVNKPDDKSGDKPAQPNESDEIGEPVLADNNKQEEQITESQPATEQKEQMADSQPVTEQKEQAGSQSGTEQKEQVADSQPEGGTDSATEQIPNNNKEDIETAPVGSSNVLQKYTVLKGDTLLGICKRHYGNADNMGAILSLNQIVNENLIYEGQIIYLP